MKHAFAYILAALVLVRLPAGAAEYTLKGERWLRLYTAERATPVYLAQIDAQRIVNNFCNVPWTKTDVESATSTFHDSDSLDTNVIERAGFDAALFCAKHVNSTHVAYANAACYRIDLGGGTLPTLTSLAMNVYSDPYNSQGARIVLLTNDSGVIPTDCKTVRGENDGGIKATNVARRISVTTGGKEYWYPSSTNLVFSSKQLGSSGLQLKRYLYVFVLLDNYSTTRGDWLEGCAYIDNAIKITTSAALPGTGDDCDIIEPYATEYHLSNGGAAKDADGDGLSNYAEYLISNVFCFSSCLADVYATDGTTPDYFRKQGELYMGEIFTDHDRIDDAWERKYPTAASTGQYDPDRDADGDGWSNYSEYLAGTDPTRVTDDNGNPAYPVPIVRMRVTTTSKKNIENVTVLAWNNTSDEYMTGIPDAIFNAVNTDGTLDFDLKTPVQTSKKTHGRLKEGKSAFIVFADLDGDGSYTVSEPMGVVKDVDVGWQGAEFAVTLSEMSAITPRFSPWSSATSDRGATVDESVSQLLSDRTVATDSGATASWASNAVVSADAVNDQVRVRIVRFGVNDTFAYLLGVGFVNPDPIVLDRTFNKNGRDFICEADFLGDDEFDLDWSRLNSEVVNSEGVKAGVGKKALVNGTVIADVTSVTYLAVLEGGTGNEYWLRGSGDTNTTIRALTTTIERRFESTKHAPVAQAVEGVCYSARPTFRWTLPNEEAYAKKYGTSYTAFNLKIVDVYGNTVYESGLRRAPAQDAEGVFTWTADVSASDLTKQGFRLASTGNFTWNVEMYNAKFKPGQDDKWSTEAKFSFAVNAQQEMNDHQYSSIDVAVKYAGPSLVIQDYANLATTNGKVRVQAFATADCSGDPLSETVVTNAVAETSSLLPNATLIGLPQTGTYYLRAYIDSDGDHEQADWESYGTCVTPVTISSSTLTKPVATVWIEDTDVDQDWLPDAWEYVKFGTISKKSASVISDSKTIFTTEAYNAATNRLASISTGLEGASLTIFENGAWAKTLLGWGDNAGDITFDNIRAAINSNIVERAQK